MNKRIVVEHNSLETRVALTEDGELVELFLERRGQERLVGNIYKGIVQNVLPGMQAAFVDIGLEKNAFLYAKDIQVGSGDMEISDEEEFEDFDIKDLIKQGQEIMVQVFKEPGGTKGTRVTTNITLPGRMLVLMPTVNYIGISRRIEDEQERERLKSVLEEIAGDSGFGLIARTSAEGKNKEDFISEFEFLKRLWEKLYEKNRVLTAPRLIHNEESLIYRTVRDMLGDDINEMVIDDEAAFEGASIVAEMIAGTAAKRVIHFKRQDENIFDFYGINSQIEGALTRKVWLKSGGYIIIDHTEALTVVDVNTGKFVGNVDFCMTALKTNMEAAVEVAKQIRLRNISGIIVVDFIDMLTEEDRQQILDILEEQLAKDKTKTSVVGMSDLGLVEITRKKERKSIDGILKQDCHYCNGTGKIMNCQTIILEIYKNIEKILRDDPGATIAVKLHESVAKAFNDHVRELFLDMDGIETAKIFLCPIKGIHEEKYEISVVSGTKEFEQGGYFSFVG